MHSRESLIWRIIGLVLALAQVAVSALLVISLIRINILESWIVAVAIGLLVILFALCMVPVFIKRKKYYAMRIMCMVVSVVVIVGGIFAFRYTDSLNNLLDKVAVSESPGTVDTGIDITKEPFIAYISGSDSHTDVDDPYARSDVNIIVVVNPAKGKILLASIPRDTYVQLHGTTGYRDKLTHAGLNNNVNLSKATLEDFLGIVIDYTIKVSFDTVVEVVDALGGISINSDTYLPLSTWTKDGQFKYCTFVEGTQYVDGDCALRFARERMSYRTGDKHRGENQQEVLTGIINKFLSSNDYLLKLPEILDIAADSFETTFMRDDITSFLRYQLNNHTNWQIESIGLDGVGDMLPTYTYGEDTPLWVMLPDEESYQEVINKIYEYSEA
ncbi:LCP family protein [Candidatus Saccharibacteria bacterium]|nr:LCP family protein [Candidatus Saccharibacteria bacterium]